MTTLIYDETFDGFLTSVFECYERRLEGVYIEGYSKSQPRMYESTIRIISCPDKAVRVWEGLKKKVGARKSNEVFKAFLSELPERENILFGFLQYAFAQASVKMDYRNKYVLALTQTAKKVHREKHRMEAFVRFQLIGDGTYFACIEPDYNVLPLIAGHFKERYADQDWIIYDKRRSYGLGYSRATTIVQEIHLLLNEEANGEFPGDTLVNGSEAAYQLLWRQYFQSVNIPARKNVALHIRHVPRRYWKYLTEKR